MEALTDTIVLGRRKRLHDVFVGSAEAEPLVAGAPNIWVTDICLDSREMRPGGVFAAVSGHEQHGLLYLDEALARGAAAVLWEPDERVGEISVPDDVVTICVPDLSRQLSGIASRFFGEPSQALKVIGVTGTNGKTTVAYLLARAYEVLGKRSAFFGTIGVGPLAQLYTNALTTPDEITVQRQLAGFVDRGFDVVAMEASSHGLAQYRVDGVQFHTGVFTNLSQDHLDYHASFDEYGATKARLFTELACERAVINTSDAFGRQLWAQLPNDQIKLSVRNAAGEALASDAGKRTLQVTSATTQQTANYDAGITGVRTHIEFVSPSGAGSVSTPLLGSFNASNVMSALGVLLLDNIPLTDACQALAQVGAPPGRMEAFGGPNQQAPLVVVDYAHTPDALGHTLQALRAITEGDLWCVFGCGGDRDRSKRALMAQAAEQHADFVVVTSDNPRTEDPQAIVRDISRGFVKQGTALYQPDRREAIAMTISNARAQDVVLIAGKGHEDYQIVGTQRMMFSDRDEVAKALHLDQKQHTEQVA